MPTGARFSRNPSKGAAARNHNLAHLQNISQRGQFGLAVGKERGIVFLPIDGRDLIVERRTREGFSRRIKDCQIEDSCSEISILRRESPRCL